MSFKPTASASIPTIRQKNQWEQDVIKTLVRDGIVDSAPHAVAILNRSPFVDLEYGKLELYDAAVYLCGWQSQVQSLSADEKAKLTNETYLAGAPKEWEDAAKHILGMTL